jgi:hypothetical protein
MGCAEHRENGTTTQPKPLSCDDKSDVNHDVADEPVGQTPQAVSHDKPIIRQSDRQVHNAELADMVVADIHFLPNRTVLNTVGTERLSHLAWIVENYGGTIKLDLDDPASQLAMQRMSIVKEYLKAYGLPDNKIQVEFGLSETKGMDAKEAINVHKNSQFKEQKEDKGLLGGDKKADGDSN